jgi:hypothetical protein
MATEHVITGTPVKVRHPLAPLGLSLITFGIYGIVWYFKINKELHGVTGEGNPTTSLLAMLFGGFIIVPPFVSWYNTAGRIQTAQERAGVTQQINPVLALVLLFIPVANIFATFYLQKSVNEAWDKLAATAAQDSLATPFPNTAIPPAPAAG